MKTLANQRTHRCTRGQHV